LPNLVRVLASGNNGLSAPDTEVSQAERHTGHQQATDLTDRDSDNLAFGDSRKPARENAR
jgi:hypothetical protein